MRRVAVNESLFESCNISPSVFKYVIQCRLVKKEMKKSENFAPFDYAQGDCQTDAVEVCYH